MQYSVALTLLMKYWSKVNIKNALSTQTTAQGRIELYYFMWEINNRQTEREREQDKRTLMQPFDFCSSTLSLSFALWRSREHLTYVSSIAQLLHSSLCVFFPKLCHSKKTKKNNPWLYCGDGETGQILIECGLWMPCDWLMLSPFPPSSLPSMSVSSIVYAPTDVDHLEGLREGRGCELDPNKVTSLSQARTCIKMNGLTLRIQSRLHKDPPPERLWHKKAQCSPLQKKK